MSVPSPSCSARPATFEACGACATETRRNASYESSGIASTVARGRATTDGTGIETLTERELQVARLVVDRKTNPEIAAELFLSQKTVETHLRNIFRKAHVSSRVALARAVEHADRVDSAVS